MPLPSRVKMIMIIPHLDFCFFFMSLTKSIARLCLHLKFDFKGSNRKFDNGISICSA